MIRKIIIYIAGVIVLSFAALYILFPGTITEKISDFIESPHTIPGTKEIFSVPLVTSSNAPHPELTVQGVIADTNSERTKAQVSVLVENQALDKAAETKLNDLFARQYFEHVSPDGHGPGYLASQQGYEYILVGENLALGNFKDDAALVAAWMASPGHRANILNTRFKNIGVAVGQGVYQGKKTWIAVQEFGAPLSDCPSINGALQVKINSDKVQVDSLTKQLDTLRQELNTMPHATPAERTAYNAKVDQYNELVGTYTSLASSLKTEVDSYNAEVQAFNACLNNSTKT